MIYSVLPNVVLTILKIRVKYNVPKSTRLNSDCKIF